MKAYGLPRTKDLMYPDIDDIKSYGLASHIGKFPKKSGDFKGYNKSEEKAKVRRFWKRKERYKIKLELKNYNLEMGEKDE